MIIRINNFSIVIILFALSSLLASCSKNPEPSAEAIREYIGKQLPNTLKLKDFKFQNFANKSGEGVGRTSVSGTAELVVDLYSPSNTAFNEDLSAAGLSAEEVDFYATNIEIAYVRTAVAGTNIPFSSEIGYTATVDRFHFEGGPHFELNGVSADHANLIRGDAAYKAILEGVIQSRTKHLKAKEIATDEVRRFFSDKGGYRYYGIENWETNMLVERFTMSLSGPVELKKEENRGGQTTLYFQVPAVAVWKTDGRWANENYKAGQSSSMILYVYIRGNRGQSEKSQRFPILLDIRVPDERGEYYSTSDDMVLESGAFIQGGAFFNTSTIKGKLINSGPNSVVPTK
jgi:hypothetical protein